MRRLTMARLVGMVLCLSLLCSACSSAQRTAGEPTGTPDYSGTGSGSFAPKVDIANRAGQVVRLLGEQAPDPQTDPQGHEILIQFQSDTQTTVKFIPKEQDKMRQLSLLVAAGNGPSLFTAEPADMPYAAARGLATPIDAYENTSDNTFLPAVTQAYQWGGKRFALQPRASATWAALLYNATEFSSAGLQTPLSRYLEDDDYTWEDAFRDSRALTLADEKTGTTLHYGLTMDSAGVFSAVSSAGGQFFQNNQNGYRVSPDQACVETVQKLADAVERGDIVQRSTTLAEFAAGTARMHIGSWADVNALYAAHPALTEKNTQIQAVPLPGGSEKKTALLPNYYLLGAGNSTADLGYYYLWYRHQAADVTPAVTDSTLNAKQVSYHQQLGATIRAGEASAFFVSSPAQANPQVQAGLTDAFSRIFAQHISAEKALSEAAADLQTSLDALSATSPLSPRGEPSLPDSLKFDPPAGGWRSKDHPSTATCGIEPISPLPPGITLSLAASGGAGVLKITASAPDGETLSQDIQSQHLFTLSDCLLPALNIYGISLEATLEFPQGPPGEPISLEVLLINQDSVLDTQTLEVAPGANALVFPVLYYDNQTIQNGTQLCVALSAPAGADFTIALDNLWITANAEPSANLLQQQ